MNHKYSTEEQNEPVAFWALKCGTQTLATLEQSCIDEGRIICFLFPDPEFEHYRALFTGEGSNQDNLASRDIYLETADHAKLKRFALRVEGTEAVLVLPRV
jgi:hypothetical protein